MMKLDTFDSRFIGLLLISIITNVFCSAQDKNNLETSKSSKDSVHNFTKLTYKIIDVAGNTFGYDIYAEGNVLIHQNSIPGLLGNNGFTTKKKAEIVARLIISKLKLGEMPPTVHIEELKKLKTIE